MVVDLAARPHITAGIALTSAAVIAAGPMTQHLPKFDVAQHLPPVSVSDIDLTDAASGMVDLFSGVESELASLAGGSSAAAVPAQAITDISPYFVNPLQTYVNMFQDAVTNLQYLGGEFNPPFPVLQQLAANGVSYASDYVGAYQSTAASLVKLIGGTTKTSFANQTINAVNDILQGNISTGLPLLSTQLLQRPIVALEDMENIIYIPSYISQNISNTIEFWTQGPGLAGLVAGYGLPLLGVPGNVLGQSLQAVYDAAATGDSLGVVTNLADIPGQLINGVINGALTSGSGGSPTGGLLSSKAFGQYAGGFLNYLVNQTLPSWSTAVVAPNAQNIEAGGSVGAGVQNLISQMQNGWPSATAIQGAITQLQRIGTTIGPELVAQLQNIPSLLANLPSAVVNFTGTLASQIGAIIVGLLKML
ncbi:hypothetical protein K3U93_03100 [Mycobacterium malmoense]|uniref:PE-PGRS family protein n=1 Tax=Mycobacterium malmoense TaxID=1780 RepID=A0ABX3SMJ9_MYCMA|nr:hypothetical protein [Mycobacterium malmoense]ORA79258.1 hypothetical protein BST29_19415 [Mycobacterium malmoense]QZA18217.1 hypothetical protein K3U93_03100 [Mycobacterium malmoense]